MNNRSFRRTLVGALVLSVLAVACGGGENPALTAPSDDASSAPLNDADATFLQGMIPHHQRATEMAALVEERTERTELRDLATTIIEDQEAEIELMRDMLVAAGVDESGAMEGMEGMMDESEMTDLEGLSGEEFDIAFIDAMTRHHETAIQMAEEVLADGENPQVADLANRIIEAQQAEIEQMATWRADWES